MSTEWIRLLDHCKTPVQRLHLEALIEYGSERKAATVLGKHRNAINQSLKQVRSHAAKAGIGPFYSRDPDHDRRAPVPSPQYVKGVSQLRDGDGNVKLEWLKTDTRVAELERQMLAMVEALAEGVEGLAPPAPPKPAECRSEALNAYFAGDPHFGMYAWSGETGQDYDIEIAFERHRTAVEYLCDNSPDTDQGVLYVMGDTFHADDDKSRTPMSGNILDTDSRYQKVYEVTTRCAIVMIERLRRKHKKLTVVVLIGNHDPRSAIAFAEHLRAYYRDQDDVEIPTAQMYHYFLFGQTLLGAHHGHGAKPDDLALIMAHDAPQQWAMSTKRYFHVGHFHHASKINLKAVTNVIVETHRTLAPNDAWHHMKGYRADSAMQCITYGKASGELFRTVYSIDRRL